MNNILRVTTRRNSQLSLMRMRTSPNKKRFVLIAELEEDGYVLGYYESLELAKQKHKEYWDLISHTSEPLNELYRFYVEDVHEMKGCLYGRTNGFLSVYVRLGANG